MSNFIVQALKGEDIIVYGNDSQARFFCYIDDLIEGMLKMMITPDEITGSVNLGNSSEFMILELAENVIRLTGSPSRIVFKFLSQDDPTQHRPDISLAKDILKWKPIIDLEIGLKKMIDYFKNLLKSRYN